MKSLLKIYRSSRIVKKLINRILIVETVSFLIIAALTLFILQPLLEAQAIEAAGDLNRYMADRIDSTVELLSSVSHYIIGSRELQSVLHDYDATETERERIAVCFALNRLTESQPNVRGIVLENDKGILFDSVTDLTQADFSLLGNPWYHGIKTSVFSKGYSILFGDNQDVQAQTLVYARSCFVGSRSYTLTIYYRAWDLLRELQRMGENSFSGYLIADRDGAVQYTHGNIPVSRSAYESGQSSDYIKMAQGMYFSDMVQTNMWNLVSFAESSYIRGSFRGFLLATFSLFILLSLLTFFLITPTIYRIIKPVDTLSKTMWQAAEGDLSAIPEFKTKDEIGDLSIIFNKMVLSIQEHIHKRIEHEQMEQKMKYSLLISQIDPHFIYNTMSIINSLARKNQTDEIVMINNALITILQDRLRVSTIEVFDTVQHELDILKQYLLIQGNRYENHAKINWEIDESALERQIPKNIIQPIVENALFHGLIDEETGDILGEIGIKIFVDNDLLRIIIHDNGRGIAARRISEILNGEQPDKKRRGRHMGLRNIRERLEYLYEQQVCMQIESKEGTTVTINLPLASGNQ